jgi:hypothetical protein
MSKGWLYLGVLVILILTHTGIFFYGQKVEGNARDAKYKKDLELAIKESEIKSKADFSEVLKTEKIKADARIAAAKRNVKIVKEIQVNEIYRDSNCNLPDSGLQLWNDEASGKIISPSEPNGEVPIRVTNEN